MQVSVVIPNLNGAHFLPPCLDSLRRQTFTDFEVIVVDQGSTDGSRHLLAEQYPEVRVVPIGRQTGFARAVNAGIAVSLGRSVALLNNDTEADPDWLAELVAALDAHPEAGFAASKMRYFDQRDVINSAGDSFRINGSPLNLGLGETDRGQYDTPGWVLGACAGAAIYRRSLIDRLGGFDESLDTFYEDADFNLRAQLAGDRCRYVPTAIVYHVGGGSSMQNPNPWWRRRARFLASRNSVAVIVQDWPDAWLRAHGWRILRHQLATVVFSFLRRQDGPSVLRGKLAALRRLPRLLARRRRIQANRRADVAELEKFLVRGD